MTMRLAGVALAAVMACGWTAEAEASVFFINFYGIQSKQNRQVTFDAMFSDASSDGNAHLTDFYNDGVGYYAEDILFTGVTGTIQSSIVNGVPGNYEGNYQSTLDFSSATYTQTTAGPNWTGEMTTETGTFGPGSINILADYFVLPLGAVGQTSFQTIMIDQYLVDEVSYASFVSAVPLPPAISMFGLALTCVGGVGFMRFRRLLCSA